MSSHNLTGTLSPPAAIVRRRLLSSIINHILSSTVVYLPLELVSRSAQPDIITAGESISWIILDTFNAWSVDNIIVLQIRN